MIRLVNQFDSGEYLPSTLVASGGENCSTCSSSCSCIVTAVAVSVLSARMVPKLKASEDATVHSPVPRKVIAAAILPLLLLPFGVAIHFDWPSLIALSPIIYIAFLLYMARGAERPDKFVVSHILLILGGLAVSVVEMIVWANIK